MSISLASTIFKDMRAKARWCYGDTSRRAVAKAVLTDGSAAMILYRLMQWSRRHRLAPLELVFNKLNAVLCHCVIGRGADFADEFVLIHSNGIVINGAVRGGERVFLEHQVTIGAERDKSPVLGSDIFVGCGARLLGDIRIGDRVKVGANAVVLCDVPADSTAVGVPARVIHRRETASEAA